MVLMSDKRKLNSRLNRYLPEIKRKKSYTWLLWALLIVIVIVISNLG